VLVFNGKLSLNDILLLLLPQVIAEYSGCCRISILIVLLLLLHFAHRTRATIALLDRETPEFIPPQLWYPNLPDLNPVDNSVWKILQECVQSMHH